MNYFVFACFYYSACYASKKEWQAAADDAKECIKLDPTFVKGYYRLATAQTELADLDGATSTIKQGLNMDPKNPQLMRQLQSVKILQKKKKAAATNSMRNVAPAGGADSAISKELQELHQAYIQSIRESKTVEANIAMAQREYKAQELTKTELEELPKPEEGADDTKMYRSIGKMFLRASRPDIMDHLDVSMKAEKKREADLKQKQQYLERKIQSQQQNIQELLPASARRQR